MLRSVYCTILALGLVPASKLPWVVLADTSPRACIVEYTLLGVVFEKNGIGLINYTW